MFGKYTNTQNIHYDMRKQRITYYKYYKTKEFYANWSKTKTEMVNFKNDRTP